MLNLKELYIKLKKIITEGFLEHEQSFIYFVGIVIVASLSFVFGILKGVGLSQKPITVMRPQNPPVVITKECEVQNTVLKQKDCVYVGSVKGKKYYPPSCSYAKKISKENLRCFTSDEDAIKKGYEKSTSC